MIKKEGRTFNGEKEDLISPSHTSLSLRSNTSTRKLQLDTSAKLCSRKRIRIGHP